MKNSQNFTPDELDNLNLQKVNEELKRQQTTTKGYCTSKARG